MGHIRFKIWLAVIASLAIRSYSFTFTRNNALSHNRGQTRKLIPTNPIDINIPSSSLYLSSQEPAEEDGEENSSRRGFFLKSIAGGAAVTGIVANGFAVQGPSPYKPAPESLRGKTIVITGGNTGLGFESAKRLAAAGAKVIITTRSPEKGTKAVQSIQKYAATTTTDADVYYVPLDLCDLSSVKEFPKALQKIPGFKNADVLLNNAGVMAIPDRQITKDGFERTFQTNHLGHFALTAVMAPLLNPAGSRVVNVSSAAYYFGESDFSNANGEKSYSPWGAYGQSKLENVLFTQELHRRAIDSGTKITAVALHPGVVRTDLIRYVAGEDDFVSLQGAVLSQLDQLKLLPFKYISKAVDRGANSQIWLSAFQGGEDIGGKFFINMKETKLTPAALDAEKAKELWALSERLSGVEFKL